MAQLIEELANDIKFEGLTPTVTENIGKRKKRRISIYWIRQAKVAQLIGKLTHDLKFEGLALTVTDTKRK